MSYILEALKKAQAERQLGATPGIDSLPPAALAAAPAPAQARWFALGSVVLLAAAVLGWFVLRPAAPPSAPVAALDAAPAPLAPVAAVPVARAPEPPPMPRPAAVPLAPPRAAAPPPEAKSAAAAPAPAPRSAADPDESLPLMSQLPAEIQRAVPAVSFGGYMYSSNPADRLLLIDKVLRKEGDNVAPGLILERLLPKCAVLNYRGTRYRVPY